MLNLENKKPLKIALLKRHFSTLGGLEKYTRLLTKKFLTLGHEVILASSDQVPFHLDHNGSHQFIPSQHFISHLGLKKFDDEVKNWLSTSQFDIVFGMDRTTNQTHLRAGNGVHRAFLERRKLVDSWLKQQTYFIDPHHTRILDLEKKAFESPNLKKLFTNSNMVKDEILQYYRVDEAKIHVVHNGVEHKELLPFFETWQETQASMQQEFRINPNDHVLLFIGNGYLRKGLLPLMQALSRCRHTPFHLIVIGKESNTAYYRKEAFRLGIDQRVSFLGVQPSIYRFYALADTLVIPSFYDPFANVTVEALSMGLFVISSQFNGGKEVLTPFSGALIESLLNLDSFASLLKNRIKERKMPEQSLEIRNSVSHLDFSNQLNQLIMQCLT